MSRVHQERQDFFRDMWEGPELDLDSGYYFIWILGSRGLVGGHGTLSPLTGLRNQVARFPSWQLWLRPEETGTSDWKESLRHL